MKIYSILGSLKRVTNFSKEIMQSELIMCAQKNLNRYASLFQVFSSEKFHCLFFFHLMNSHVQLIRKQLSIVILKVTNSWVKWKFCNLILSPYRLWCNVIATILHRSFCTKSWWIAKISIRISTFTTHLCSFLVCLYLSIILYMKIIR